MEALIPVPLKDTTAVLPVVELLLMVRFPVDDPVVVGKNWTCNVIDWLGFSVVGRVPPTMEKPAPVIEAELTVTADVPDDVSVTDCVAAKFTATLPKLRLVALTVSCGVVVGGGGVEDPLPHEGEQSAWNCASA
jgi:hypothetical protein